MTTTPFGVAGLGISLSQPFPSMSEGSTPIYSSISKSQLEYSQRVKEKVAKQLLKNEELLAKVVAETPVEGVEGYPKVVLNAVNFAPVVGLSWGGDERRLLDLFSVIDKEKEPLIDFFVPKVKGKRELKNLECSINFEARGRKSSQAKC
jgi:hypothetical protein